MRSAEEVRRNGRGITLTVAILALGSAIYLATGDPKLPHDSVLDVVFDTRWMVAGARLVVVVAGIYVVVSAAVRIARGQWAKSAGVVSADVQEIAGRAEVLREVAVDAQGEIDDLRDQLEKSTAALDDLDNLDRS